MFEVIMPKLGLTMESGIIEKWHKKEGDSVETGDVLFEVMTDKVALEVESYNSGILRKIIRFEGEEVPVTEVLAYIGEKDEKIPEEPSVAPKEAVPERNSPSLEESSDGLEKGNLKKDVKENNESETSDKRIKISPLAKKIAQDNQIDITKIKGAGPGGRIIKEDIISIIDSKKAVNTGKKQDGINIRSSSPLTGVRKIIAERMSESKRAIPHMSLRIKVDATNLISLREQIKEKFKKLHDVKVTYTDFIVKACAAALEENIELNSSFLNDNFIIYKDINIGIAVATDGSLVVPTIYKCNGMNLIDIAKKRYELVKKAREGGLSLDDITNGTFTITNLGMLGIRSSIPIINPPQAAIIAIGEMYDEPTMVNGEIALRSFMEMTLSCDHRIIDGDKSSLFLKSLKGRIENPLELII